MNPRVTLGLLAILLALGGYVYFGGPSGGGESASPGAKDKPAAAQVDVFKFEDRETRRLAVQQDDRQAVVEKDADGTWRIQPGGEPADRVRVNGIVLRMGGLRASRAIAEPGSLADFGLTTPSTTTTIQQADGTTYTLLLGGKAPAESGTYVKRPDNPVVYVVSNTIAQDLERLLTEPPREPTPIPIPSPTPAEPDPSATPGP